MKLRYLFPLILALPSLAQTTNSDILPASSGLNLGRTNQRWNGFFQNVNITGTCTFNNVPCTFGSGGGGGVGTVTGTANQINVSGTNVFTLSSTLVAPGTLTVNSSGFILSGSSGGFTYYPSSSGLFVQDQAFQHVTPFTAGADPCAKILTGMNALASSNNGVVDARGLGTGNLTPCSAANAHAMFNSATSGNVMLGNYTLWVPLSEAAAGTLGTTNLPPQGIIPLPNKFIGVIGAGRGDASTSLGTTIAVCKGANNPVTGCVAPDTTRILAITTTDITYAGGRTYMGVNVSGSDIVAGEPVRIKSSTTKANNGPYRVCNLNISNSTRTDTNCPANPTASKFYVVVPSGVTSVTIGGTNTGYTTPVAVNVTGNSCTAAPVLTATQSGGVVNSVIVQFPGYGCTSTGAGPPTATLTSGGSNNATLTLNLETACAASCGSVIGGIPVFDTTPLSGNQFAQQLRYLAIDCEGVLSCVGFRSLSGNEQAGADHVKIAGSPERALDFHQFVGQNADTLKSMELYGGTSLGTACDVGTVGAFFGENGPHGVTDTTINFGNCAHTVIAGFVIDTNTYPVGIDKTHCENTQKCYLAGQDSPAQYFHLANNAGGPTSQCGDSASMAGNVNTSGTAVTWVSGQKFNEYFVGQTITINASPFTVLSVTNDTSLTLTGSAGTLSNKAYTLTSVAGNCVPGDGPYQNGTSSVVTISAEFKGSGSPATKDYTIMTMVRSTSSTNVIEDWRNTTTATTDHISNQNSLEMYSFDNSPTGCNALITTDSGILNNFCFLGSTNIVTAPGFTSTGSSGIVNGATIVQSGTASNTDFSGELTFAAGTVTRNWTGTYTSHPECIATDQSAANAVRVTYTGVASVTFTGTGTDTISYICGGRD